MKSFIMKQLIRWTAGIGMMLTACILLSWRTGGFPLHTPVLIQDNDTVPNKKSNEKWYRVEGGDNAWHDIDNGRMRFGTDTRKIREEIRKAMSQVREIDAEKIERTIRASLKNIDWERTGKDIERSLRDAEIKIGNLDVKRLQKEIMEDATSHIKIDMDNMVFNMNRNWSRWSEEMKKMETYMKKLETFIDELEKDHLIDKKKGYKLKIKDRKIFIDDKEQPKEINEKYSKYLDQDITVTTRARGAVRV